MSFTTAVKTGFIKCKPKKIKKKKEVELDMNYLTFLIGLVIFVLGLWMWEDVFDNSYKLVGILLMSFGLFLIKVS